MRKQLVYCLVACALVAPLLLIAKNPDGTLRPLWAKAKPNAQIEAKASTKDPPGRSSRWQARGS